MYTRHQGNVRQLSCCIYYPLCVRKCMTLPSPVSRHCTKGMPCSVHQLQELKKNNMNINNKLHQYTLHKQSCQDGRQR